MTPHSAPAPKRPTHCWIGNTEMHGIGTDEWAEAFLHPATCMLEDGHEGPHEFTPDNEIGVTFA